MKAVIMAGGEGQRLRPLTLNLPKPMARLCGTPVIEYILALLKKHHIYHCTISTGYMQADIEEYMIERPEDGMKICTVGEAIPLGTAGGVRHALKGHGNDDFLVISGDALCNTNLTQAIKCHQESNADVTIIVKQVDDPGEYGLVLSDSKGIVKGFVEKPPLSQAVTTNANTGIYIISKSILDLIPCEKYDFANDLFPRLLEEGYHIQIWEDAGYWCDIGDLDSYYQCQCDLLTGKTGIKVLFPRHEKRLLPFDGLETNAPIMNGPVYIGANVKIGEGVQITGPAVIDDGVTIGGGCNIHGGVLLENAYIGHGVTLDQAILCKGASVKSGARLLSKCVVGSKAQIGQFSLVEPGIKIWPYQIIPDNKKVYTHQIELQKHHGLFGDDGFSGEVGVELTPSLLTRLGSAIGSASGKCTIGIACCEHGTARALKMALVSGIQSTGSSVVDFGEIYRSLFHFCLFYTAGKLGIYISCSSRQNTVQIMDTCALGCSRELERKIEGLLSRGEFVKSDLLHFGDYLNMQGMQILYAKELLRHAPYGLNGLHAQMESSNPLIKSLMLRTLQSLGCDTESGMKITISQDGMNWDISDKETGSLNHEHLFCMLAYIELEKGHEISVPFTAPRVLEQISSSIGGAVLRYYTCPTGASDSKARELAAEQMYFRDALIACIRLLSYLKTSGKSLSDLFSQIPPFQTIQSEITDIDLPIKMMQEIRNQGAATDGEGLILTNPLGIALIQPDKLGHRIKILAEAASSETAQEICADVLASLQRIKEERLDNHSKER